MIINKVYYDIYRRSVLMLLLDIRDLIHTSSMDVIVRQVHLI